MSDQGKKLDALRHPRDAQPNPHCSALTNSLASASTRSRSSGQRLNVVRRVRLGCCVARTRRSPGPARPTREIFRGCLSSRAALHRRGSLRFQAHTKSSTHQRSLASQRPRHASSRPAPHGLLCRRKGERHNRRRIRHGRLNHCNNPAVMFNWDDASTHEVSQISGCAPRSAVNFSALLASSIRSGYRIPRS